MQAGLGFLNRNFGLVCGSFTHCVPLFYFLVWGVTIMYYMDFDAVLLNNIM